MELILFDNFQKLNLVRTVMLSVEIEINDFHLTESTDHCFDVTCLLQHMLE